MQLFASHLKMILHYLYDYIKQAEDPNLKTEPWCQCAMTVCLYLKRHTNGLDISRFAYMIQIKL